jgi:hypothetical protein
MISCTKSVLSQHPHVVYKGIPNNATCVIPTLDKGQACSQESDPPIPTRILQKDYDDLTGFI